MLDSTPLHDTALALPDDTLGGPLATTLLARRQFGAGRDAERSVLDLLAAGVRTVVAPSFDPAFQICATRHGMVTAQVLHRDVTRLRTVLDREPATPVRVSLDSCTIRAAGTAVRFTMDPENRRSLLAKNEDAPPRALADRTSALAPMRLVETMLLARRHNAVDLASGSPTLPGVAPVALDAAVAALRDGHNQYENPAGNAELRAAAAELTPGATADEVTITSGATEALTVALQALAGPGDEVVVFEPFYEAFPTAVRLAGARPRFVRLRGPDWHWDPAELRRAFNSRTRAVIVNSPHNPTGAVLPDAAVRELGALCAHWHVPLISDEAYADFVAAGRDLRPPSAVPGAVEQLVVLRSLSKSHALSGWRIGWVQAPEALTATFRMVHESLTVGAAAPLQRAAAHLLRDQPHLSPTDRNAMADNQKVLGEALAAVGLTPPESPPSVCYLFAGLPGDRRDADEFVRTLITRQGVALAAGTSFYADPAVGGHWVRASCNKSPESVTAAAARLAGDVPR